MAERRVRRSWLLPALRAASWSPCVVFAWLGLRGRFDEIADALARHLAAGVAARWCWSLLGCWPPACSGCG